MNVSSKFSEVTTKLKIKEKQNTAILLKMTKNRIFTKKQPVFVPTKYKRTNKTR